MTKIAGCLLLLLSLTACSGKEAPPPGERVARDYIDVTIDEAVIESAQKIEQLLLDLATASKVVPDLEPGFVPTSDVLVTIDYAGELDGLLRVLAKQSGCGFRSMNESERVVIISLKVSEVSFHEVLRQVGTMVGDQAYMEYRQKQNILEVTYPTHTLEPIE